MVDSKNFVKACAYCNAIEDEGSWKPVNNKDYNLVMGSYGYVISHGACKPCAEKAMEEVRQYHN